MATFEFHMEGIEELESDLNNNFDKETTNDIMYMNARKLFNKVK